MQFITNRVVGRLLFGITYQVSKFTLQIKRNMQAFIAFLAVGVVSPLLVKSIVVLLFNGFPWWKMDVYIELFITVSRSGRFFRALLIEVCYRNNKPIVSCSIQ